MPTVDQVLRKMRLPSQKRRGVWRGGVLQIRITGACDRACADCTQGTNIKGSSAVMPVEQFEEAVRSLEGYWGVVGIFGGNPCLHPRFDRICDILRKHVPWEQRGIWTNRVFDKGRICRETFNPAVSNINVHMDKDAIVELRESWPEALVLGRDKPSRHSPVLTAMCDLIEDEDTRWDLITSCEINQSWSAMILPIGGKLLAYFCEIAGMLDLIHADDPDWRQTGSPVEPGWWKRRWIDGPAGRTFYDQVCNCCHRCGVPLRGTSVSQDAGILRVTRTHRSVAQTRSLDVVEVTDLADVGCRSSFIAYVDLTREKAGNCIAEGSSNKDC